MADAQQTHQAYTYAAAGQTVSEKPTEGTPQQQQMQMQPQPQPQAGQYSTTFQPQQVPMQQGYGAPPGGQFTQMQPVVQWMAPPPSIPGVPPGLEYLTQVDQLLVHQQIEIMEMMTGWEMCNKYQIKNSLGQLVYFATEESGLCMRQCFGPNRGFVMHIANNYNQEVIRIVREFKCGVACCWCCCGCCECCATEVSIEAPVGQVIGTVKQQCSVTPRYAVNNAQDETVFYVDGPCCPVQFVCCPSDVEFPVTAAGSGQEIGKITKQWTGFFQEAFTNADYFAVSFPMDLDVHMKAVMLGAVFLIDFRHFETPNKNKR